MITEVFPFVILLIL